MGAPLHGQEEDRIVATKRLNLFDMKPDVRFDEITIEAVDKLAVPISTISILNKEKEFYKSCQGLYQSDGPREQAFCSWALLAQDLFVIEDTLLDDRFRDNPYVTGPPFIRFYAGISLMDEQTGLPVAVFCVKDTVARKFNEKDLEIFLDLADRATTLINQEEQ